jgi:NADH:ubiquinone oxidoreductase subunit K
MVGESSVQNFIFCICTVKAVDCSVALNLLNSVYSYFDRVKCSDSTNSNVKLAMCKNRLF